jgi:hypothetical protein
VPSIRRAVAVALLFGVVSATTAWSAAPRTSASEAFVHVAIVVERPDASAVVRVVTVPRGSSGATVLATLSEEEGWGAPIYDSTWSGFLCAIDDRPSASPTCLTQFNAHQPTWALWTVVAGHWHYATTGLTSLVASEGAVEAWRLEPGTASFGKVTPPSSTADFAALSAHQSTLDRHHATPSNALAGALGLGVVAGLAGLGLVLRRRSR